MYLVMNIMILKQTMEYLFQLHTCIYVLYIDINILHTYVRTYVHICTLSHEILYVHNITFIPLINKVAYHYDDDDDYNNYNNSSNSSSSYGSYTATTGTFIIN